MKNNFRFLLPVMALVFTLLLSGCCLSHQWTPATYCGNIQSLFYFTRRIFL